MTRRAGSICDRDCGLAAITVQVRQVISPWEIRPDSPHEWFYRMKISFKRLDNELPTPSHAHEGDGAVDLYARHPASMEPGERTKVPTGIAVAIPVGFAGLVVPRSGLAAKQGVGVTNGPGLIDAGYRGEIAVLLVNHGLEPVHIARGDRIAQLMVVPVVEQELVEVDELPDSLRADGGFGSTGR